MSEYQFINTSSSSGGQTRDDASRRLVRQNAMHAFFRQKASFQSNNSAPPTLLSSDITLKSAIRSHSNKFKLASWTKTSRKKRKAVQAERSHEQEAKDGLESAKSHDQGHKSVPTNHSNSPEGSRLLIESSPEVNSCFGSNSLRLETSEDAQISSISLPRIYRFPATAVSMDPFLSAALPLNGRMQELIHRYILDIPQSIHPIKTYNNVTQSFVLTMAISDEALLHAIIAYSLMHEACYGKNTIKSPSQMTRFVHSNREFLSHQLQAIRLLNGRLEEGNVSDALIAAVMTLVWRQSWTGATKETEAHFIGLQHMINFRGGLKSLPRALAMAVVFTDYKHSTRTHSKPAFPEFLTEFNPMWTFDSYMPNFGKAFLLDDHFPNMRDMFGEELYGIIRDIYHYAALIDHYRFRDVELGPEHHKYFEDWHASLYHRLLSYPTIEIGLGLSDLSFFDAVRTAILLWIDTGLWRFGTATALVRAETARLESLLKQSDLQLWREACPDLLLWIFVIGGCSSIEVTSRSFFACQLKVLALSTNICSQQEIEQILKRFVYLDGVYTVPLRVLWGEVWESMIGVLVGETMIEE